jgi:hypothetical protein
MNRGNWKIGLIDISEDDDLTAEINLGKEYDYLDIILPTLDSCTVSLQVSEKSNGTFQALGNSVTTRTTTGGYSTVFNLGGWKYIKIKTSASQTADREIKVRGIA